MLHELFLQKEGQGYEGRAGRIFLQEKEGAPGQVVSCAFVLFLGFFFTGFLVSGLASLERAKESMKKIKSALESNLFVGSALVDLCIKCGDTGDVRNVFVKMLERNVVTWTTLVAAYARNGDVKEALRLYNQMHHTGIKASSYTFTGVLMACADMTILQHGKEIHKDIIISGLQSNDFVGSALDKICERSVVFWTALIAGYVQNKQFGDTL